MQIESLKVFCDLAESHSFTKAAEVNSITQSAVSQSISTLERHFKSLLAERSKKNFRLTREGQVVYDFSKRILQGFDTLKKRMEEARSLAFDNIRLATIYSVGLHNLPPCLSRFAKSHPAIKVLVEYRRAKQVYEEVLDGAADLGVVAYPTQMPKLEAVNLKSDRLVLICHPRHPFAKLKTVKLKMLNGQRFLNLSPELPTGKALHKLLRKSRLTVDTVNDFDSIDALKRAVEIDSGIGIVPQTTVVQEVANIRLSSVAIEGDPARPLAVVYRKSKVLSPGMREFVSLLKESL